MMVHGSLERSHGLHPPHFSPPKNPFRNSWLRVRDTVFPPRPSGREVDGVEGLTKFTQLRRCHRWNVPVVDG